MENRFLSGNVETFQYPNYAFENHNLIDMKKKLVFTSCFRSLA